MLPSFSDAAKKHLCAGRRLSHIVRRAFHHSVCTRLRPQSVFFQALTRTTRGAKRALTKSRLGPGRRPDGNPRLQATVSVLDTTSNVSISIRAALVSSAHNTVAKVAYYRVRVRSSRRVRERYYSMSDVRSYQTPLILLSESQIRKK